MAKKKRVTHKSKKDPELDQERPFLDLDQDRLDEEWIAQPKLYFEWAEKLADARLARDTAKTKVEVVRANLGRDIREDPESFDIPKITESVVAATIIQQPEFKAAQTNLLQAQHSMGVLEAAVVSLDHRKKALENLVYLHGQNYFSSPRVEGEAGEVIEEEVKKRVRRKKRS